MESISFTYFAVQNEMSSLIFAKIKKISYNLSFTAVLISFFRVKVVMLCKKLNKYIVPEPLLDGRIKILAVIFYDR